MGCEGLRGAQRPTPQSFAPSPVFFFPHPDGAPPTNSRARRASKGQGPCSRGGLGKNSSFQWSLIAERVRREGREVARRQPRFLTVREHHAVAVAVLLLDAGWLILAVPALGHHHVTDLWV